MSIRLQVLVEEAELAEIREIAMRQRMTVSEWVRQALRSARREQPRTRVQSKLDAIRAAAELDFPVADIDRMLAEIEQGYRVNGVE